MLPGKVSQIIGKKEDMTCYRRIIVFLSAVFFTSVSYAGVEVPPNDELRTLIKSYRNETGETGETIAYIPIKKPCVNGIFKGKHTEYCFINKGEDLSKSDKMGFYVTLKDAVNGSVTFSYDTLWYSQNCRIFLDKQKISCDKPYG